MWSASCRECVGAAPRRLLVCLAPSSTAPAVPVQLPCITFVMSVSERTINVKCGFRAIHGLCAQQERCRAVQDTERLKKRGMMQRNRQNNESNRHERKVEREMIGKENLCHLLSAKVRYQAISARDHSATQSGYICQPVFVWCPETCCFLLFLCISASIHHISLFLATSVATGYNRKRG